MSQLIVHVCCHFVPRTHRHSGDCCVIDDLDKVMEVILELSFILKLSRAFKCDRIRVFSA